MNGRFRAWQTRTLQALETWGGDPFLVSAAPGAGKTRPAIEQAARMLATRQIRRVVVACPTAPLTRQWAAAAAERGVQLQPDAPEPTPPREFHGVAVTYARIAADPRLWARGVRGDTLVIADEVHHLGDELAWGAGFETAFAATRWLLLLSGTAFRSDGKPIPGIRYDEDGFALPDTAYSYAQAVRDGVCRPVVFVTFDGTLSWRVGNTVVESTFETVLDRTEASRRYRTAISTELPDGMPRILREANDRLAAIRRDGHPDAGALAVAADSTHARQIVKLIGETTGRPPVVVLHTDPNASRKLAQFRRSSDPWIVAVNMVSEGVDIPRLRVGVYATAMKTPLAFRQIIGRFVRTIPGLPHREPSWVYLPADPVLRDHAGQLEEDVRVALADSDGETDERVRETADTEEKEVFEPLAAGLEQQMTLFGPAPPPRRAAVIQLPDPDPIPLSVDPPVEEPVYQRRERLREQRHRLVSEICRAEKGVTHRDVNTWINRTVGVRRVQDATIEQLTRSIELLESRLGGPSLPRRRATG